MMCEWSGSWEAVQYLSDDLPECPACSSYFILEYVAPTAEYKKLENMIRHAERKRDAALDELAIYDNAVTKLESEFWAELFEMLLELKQYRKEKYSELA